MGLHVRLVGVFAFETFRADFTEKREIFFIVFFTMRGLVYFEVMVKGGRVVAKIAFEKF